MFLSGKCHQHIYTVVTLLAPVAEPDLFKRVEVGEKLDIHLLGVEKEVEMKEAFLVRVG